MKISSHSFLSPHSRASLSWHWYRRGRDQEGVSRGKSRDAHFPENVSWSRCQKQNSLLQTKKKRSWNEVQSLGEDGEKSQTWEYWCIGYIFLFSVSWMLWHQVTHWLERNSIPHPPRASWFFERAKDLSGSTSFLCKHRSSHSQPPPLSGSYIPGGNSPLPYSS